MAMTKVKALQMWCKKMADGYRDVEVRDMAASWKSGLAFCAIIHRYRPDLIDYDSLAKENVFDNNQLAFEVAEKQLNIPAFLEADDMVAIRVPDRLSVVTYVSQYYNYFHDKPQLGGPGCHMYSQSGKSKENITQPAHQTPPKTKIGSAQSKKERQESIADKCTMCHEKVYLLERHIENSKLYHRSCFRRSDLSPTSRVFKRQPFSPKEEETNDFHSNKQRKLDSEGGKKSRESPGSGLDFWQRRAQQKSKQTVNNRTSAEKGDVKPEPAVNMQTETSDVPVWKREFEQRDKHDIGAGKGIIGADKIKEEEKVKIPLADKFKELNERNLNSLNNSKTCDNNIKSKEQDFNVTGNTKKPFRKVADDKPAVNIVLSPVPRPRKNVLNKLEQMETDTGESHIQKRVPRVGKPCSPTAAARKVEQKSKSPPRPKTPPQRKTAEFSLALSKDVNKPGNRQRIDSPSTPPPLPDFSPPRLPTSQPPNHTTSNHPRFGIDTSYVSSPSKITHNHTITPKGSSKAKSPPIPKSSPPKLSPVSNLIPSEPSPSSNIAPSKPPPVSNIAPSKPPPVSNVVPSKPPPVSNVVPSKPPPVSNVVPSKPPPVSNIAPSKPPPVSNVVPSKPPPVSNVVPSKPPPASNVVPSKPPPVSNIAPSKPPRIVVIEEKSPAPRKTNKALDEGCIKSPIDTSEIHVAPKTVIKGPNTEHTAVTVVPNRPHDEKQNRQVFGGLLKSLADVRNKYDVESDDIPKLNGAISDKENKTNVKINGATHEEGIQLRHRIHEPGKSDLKKGSAIAQRPKSSFVSQNSNLFDSDVGKKPYTKVNVTKKTTSTTTVVTKTDNIKGEGTNTVTTETKVADGIPEWKRKLEQRKQEKARPKTAYILDEKSDLGNVPLWQIEAEKRKEARKGGYVDPEKSRIDHNTNVNYNRDSATVKLSRPSSPPHPSSPTRKKFEDHSDECVTPGVEQMDLPGRHKIEYKADNFNKEKPMEVLKKKIIVDHKFDFDNIEVKVKPRKEKPPRPASQPPTSPVSLTNPKQYPVGPPPPTTGAYHLTKHHISTYQIQRQLELIDTKLTHLELKGRTLEDSIRNAKDEEEDDLMISWFQLVGEKNDLVRNECDYIYVARQQDLELEQQQIDQQLRDLGEKRNRTKADDKEERYLVEKLVDVVNQRSKIVDSIDEDRLRYLDEDSHIEAMLIEKGFLKNNKDGAIKKTKKNKKSH